MSEEIRTISNEKLESDLLRLPQTLDSLNKELLDKQKKMIEIIAIKKSKELRIKKEVAEEMIEKDGKKKQKFHTVQERDLEAKRRASENKEYNALLEEENKLKWDVEGIKNDVEFIKYSHKSLVAISHMKVAINKEE